MKNYTYGWMLKLNGYEELSVNKYDDRQLDMMNFVSSMSAVISDSNCGWSGVRYEIMKKENGHTEEYMVLYCDGGGSRWIPITGNSKGCNFSVLGENLW